MGTIGSLHGKVGLSLSKPVDKQSPIKSYANKMGRKAYFNYFSK